MKCVFQGADTGTGGTQLLEQSQESGDVWSRHAHSSRKGWVRIQVVASSLESLTS